MKKYEFTGEIKKIMTHFYYDSQAVIKLAKIHFGN